MKRENKYSRFVLLVLFFISCHSVHKLDVIVNCDDTTHFQIKDAFMLVFENDTSLVTGYGYLFFNCEVFNNSNDTVALGRINFDKNTFNKERNNVACYLNTGDSLSLFAENKVFSDRDNYILPHDTLIFTLSFDTYKNSRSEYMPIYIFDSIAHIVDSIVWRTADRVYVFEKSEKYKIKHIIHNVLLEGEGIKADMPDEYYRISD